jgi:hypothetical protein
MGTGMGGLTGADDDSSSLQGADAPHRCGGRRRWGRQAGDRPGHFVYPNDNVFPWTLRRRAASSAPASGRHHGTTLSPPTSRSARRRARRWSRPTPVVPCCSQILSQEGGMTTRVDGHGVGMMMRWRSRWASSGTTRTGVGTTQRRSTTRTGVGKTTRRRSRTPTEDSLGSMPHRWIGTQEGSAPRLPTSHVPLLRLSLVGREWGGAMIGAW